MSCFVKLASLLFACCWPRRSNRVGPQPIDEEEEEEDAEREQSNTTPTNSPSTSSNTGRGIPAPVFPPLDTVGWTTPARVVAEKLNPVGEQALLQEIEDEEFVSMEIELEKSLLHHEIVHVLSADCKLQHGMEEEKMPSRKRTRSDARRKRNRTQLTGLASSTTTVDRPKAAVRRRRRRDPVTGISEMPEVSI